MTLIRRLRDSFSSLNELISNNGWQAGQGFQQVRGKKEAPELYNKKWLPSGKMPRYLIDPEVLETLPKQGMHRTRDTQIYNST
jgi:hypothetical protein